MANLQTPRQNAQDALLALERSVDLPAFERAKAIVAFLGNYGIPQPFVFPTEIKGVQLEWHGGGIHEMDIEILPDGQHVCFVGFVNGRHERDEDALGNQIEIHLRSWAAWMMGL